MDIHDIEMKSLVVAIWDKDSKSKDDYIAGVCISDLFLLVYNGCNKKRLELVSEM